MIYAIGLLAILGVLFLFGRKSVHHEITVNASPEKVWSVLINTDKYNDWNPVMELLEGVVKEGSKVKYNFTQTADSNYDIDTYVKKVTPTELLHQGGGVPGIITFDHRYILEKSAGGTKLTIHEDYRGIYVLFWNPAPVEAAYSKLNEAIKKRVEEI